MNNNIYTTKKYLLIEEDNVNKKMFVIAEYIDKYNALHVMESICENLLLTKNGYDNKLKYYNHNDHNRPYSFYIEKPDRIDGLNVVHKYADKGIFYNNVHHKKIKSFYICEKTERYMNLNDETVMRSNIFCHIQLFDNCMKELINTIKPFDE